MNNASNENKKVVIVKRFCMNVIVNNEKNPLRFETEQLPDVTFVDVSELVEEHDLHLGRGRDCKSRLLHSCN